MTVGPLPARRVAPALAIAALLVAMGCGSDATPQTQKTEGGGPTPTPTARVTPSSTQRTQLLAQLAKIDPSWSDPSSVERAVSVCDEVRAGKNGDEVIDAARTSFGGDEVQAADAAAAVLVIKSVFCS